MSDRALGLRLAVEAFTPHKRTIGMGTVYQRKDGRWAGVIKRRGIRHTFYAHSRAEARAKLDKWMGPASELSRIAERAWARPGQRRTGP